MVCAMFVCMCMIVCSCDCGVVVVWWLWSVCGRCVFGWCVFGVGCAVCLMWHAEKPAVCTFETSPCVPATRPHDLYMWTCQYARRRLKCALVCFFNQVLMSHLAAFKYYC